MGLQNFLILQAKTTQWQLRSQPAVTDCRGHSGITLPAIRGKMTKKVYNFSKHKITNCRKKVDLIGFPDKVNDNEDKKDDDKIWISDDQNDDENLDVFCCEDVSKGAL